MEKLYSFEKSYAMYEKAQKIIPGGVYGVRSPYFVTFGSYPVYIERGKGSRFWDVDGNEYIDYMSSYGPNILGFCHEEVDEAVIAQIRRGNSFNVPTPIINDLAEKMVEVVDDMDWVIFGKNGSDATAFAITLARLETGKKMVLKAEGDYHTGYFWDVPSNSGIPAEYKAHLAEFKFNDLEDLKRVVAEHSGNIAAIIMNPFKHNAMYDQELPIPELYPAIEDHCKQEGALFIMDDIRCNFRIHLQGSHRYFNAHPDLVCFGKCLSNGYAISACMGKEPLINPAQNVYFSATYFLEASPMAASLATLKIMEREDVVGRIYKTGTRLKEGILAQSAEAGIGVNYTGHVAMPMVRFEDDSSYDKARYFCGEASKRGIYLHPYHNMFINGAHSDEDLEKTLEVTRICFSLLQDKIEQGFD